MRDRSISPIRTLSPVIAAAVAAGFVGGLAASWLVLALSHSRLAPPAMQRVMAAAPDMSVPPSFATVARAVTPSVVNIDTVV
ncbi:MAG: hypothetical protein JSV65_04195, partial [Armatimonadota bacterium]